MLVKNLMGQKFYAIMVLKKKLKIKKFKNCRCLLDYLKNKLSKVGGFEIRFNADTFNEFVLKCPKPATEVRDSLLEHKILAGFPLGGHYPELADSLLLCATEMNTVEAIDRLTEKLEGI